MTTADVVAKVLAGEHGDFVCEAVALVARELMEAEISAQIGAGRGGVSSERTTHRNGYRPRGWETRVGELELLVPRARSGPAYFPSFLEPRRRAEQAIVAVVLEAYVNGVSTRKVDRLVEQLGLQGMTKDRVSALCRLLDGQVRVFRERPLSGAYPYLWLDAKRVKVRSQGHVRSKALVIAYAVHESGVREVIGLDLGEVESEAFWVEFLRSLKARGLSGVRLAISDQHEGLKHAIARILDCPWQRCTVHFVRNMHQHCRPSQRGLVSAALRELFNAETGEQARERLDQVIERLEPAVPKVCRLLEDAEDDLLAFYAFPATHWSKLRSTPSSESTARSDDEPTSSGSSQPTPP
jgi:transposase-like protein